MFARNEINRLATVVAPLLVAALVTSCASTWKVQSRPPRDILLASEAGKKPPDKMLVHEIAGKSVIVYRPAIREDSLVGLVDAEVGTRVAESWSGPRSARTYAVRQETAIPLDAIANVEIRGRSTGKTLAIWGVALGIYAAIIAATYEPMTMY